MGEKLFSVGILIFHHLITSSFGNRNGIKQAYNLDWPDINAGLCICFLSLVSIKSYQDREIMRITLVLAYNIVINQN